MTAERIKRIWLTGLLKGVEGFSPPEGLRDRLIPVFECEGFDYFVHQIGNDEWHITKCADDGHALSEYVVFSTKKGMTCDCQSGRRHLACRHKEMAEFLLNGSRSEEKLKQRSKALAEIASAKAELERVKKLLEK